MATLPTRLVEIEFDAGVWTDVSADVVQIATQRGRNRELGAFETGTMTFTVRNDGRKYDPDNSAGPYYGKLRPNRRVRFRATYNAITYPVIQGYLDRITQNPGGPNDATAEFAASDLFKLLNRVELPVSVYAAEVTADTPVAWWTLSEPNDAAVARDATGHGYDAVYADNPTRGAAGLAVRDPSTSTTFVHASPNRVEYAGNLITGYPFTIEALVQVANSNTDFRMIYDDEHNSLPLNQAVYLFVDDNASGNQGKVGLVISGSSLRVVYSSARIDDGAVHHVAAVVAANNDTKIYVDGVDVSVMSLTGTPTFPTGTYRTGIGNNPAFSSSIGNLGLGGQAQNVAVYNTALSAARVAAHNTAARTPWRGDLPGARLGRVLDLAAVPAADRNIDTGTTTLQSTSLGSSALGYAQKVEETELGELFVSRDGKIRFVGRQAALTGGYLTSQFTLVDDDSGAGIPYTDVSADVDEATVITRATVSRDGSIAVQYGDTAAQTEFKLIDENHDGLLHDDDAYSLYYAQWLVNTHKSPVTRVGTVNLELPTNPATMYPAVLGVEIADQVTYKRKPQNTGAVITIPMRVEAIAHETGGAYWHTTLQLSPFNLAGGVPVGVWDTSLWDQAVWGF